MNVTLAKTAGFCPGVQRAVDLVEQAAQAGRQALTYGPIIHNHHVVERFASMGVGQIDHWSESPQGACVIIRSHGVGPEVYAGLEERGADIIDATCPFVRRIHELVQKGAQEGRFCIIVGVRTHPEVTAIAGWCGGHVIVQTPAELEEWFQEDENRKNIPMLAVSQTTSTKKLWENCTKILKKLCTNCEIFDTICSATEKRQREAAQLSRSCDAMIVIGDKNSSNTKRLSEICLESCRKTLLIDSGADLRFQGFAEMRSVGITAGASTPAWIIKEVYNMLSDETKVEGTAEPGEIAAAAAAEPNEASSVETVAAAIEEAPVMQVENTPAVPAEHEKAAEAPVTGEETFDQLLEQYDKSLSTGEKVTGVVTAINSTEIAVDLGTKHAGYIPFSEVSDDPTVKPEDVFKVGDEIDVYVIRVNDAEGTVALSKKRLDVQKNWDEVEKLAEDKTVIDAYITEQNKGGLVANYKGVRVFIPASQTGVPKSGDMGALVHTNQKMKITEINRARKRVVGSIRAVLSEERKAKAEQVWSEIEVGKKYKGVVKSLTSYGAFVDVGGVDGMVHVSELSWTRIKNPAEVVSVGDEIEVHVISYDPDKKKISLGYKTEDTNPWTIFLRDYHVGDVVNVKIVKLMTFGAFAEIIPGIDGLIHISQIADRRIGKPEDVLSEGQMVDAEITEIDTERKRISLSIRALLEEQTQRDQEDAVEGPAEVPVYQQSFDHDEPAQGSAAQAAAEEAEPEVSAEPETSAEPEVSVEPEASAEPEAPMEEPAAPEAPAETPAETPED